MLARIKSWTTRYLSYAGRIQLVKSVLYSIQVYWSQVFVLPKKVVQMIEATCRSFLWTGGSDLSKKALIAWDRVCLPKAAGGLNILDIYTWNWAAIGKLLWNICRKKDCLWVKWIHAYYIKTGEVWETKTTKASWVVQKIIKAKSMFEKIGLHETDVVAMTKYSIKDMYRAYRGEFQKQENEDIDHLLFECMYAKHVWSKLLAWQSIKREVWNWKHEVQWAIENATGKTAQQEVYKMLLAGGVYHLWQERNARIFKESSRSADQVVKQLIREIHVRARRDSRLDRYMKDLNFYP
ncbi:PREDICTED: uncharacterized protein LOC109220174 [Nicotiana attenuata]|uniref:uncharacterized protein LOC109220174 n=1 Tax=Nicotiana attenuata TaxID=49451 RepID=UPI0009058CCD|nr:PREDICTED: uncharacterized protein LOC109220174 [Nicotiana attenuata]